MQKCRIQTYNQFFNAQRRLAWRTTISLRSPHQFFLAKPRFSLTNHNGRDGLRLIYFAQNRLSSSIFTDACCPLGRSGPILFGPVMGEWIDVLKKKPLLRGLDAGRGLVSLTLCVQLLRGHTLSMGVVYGSVGLYAVCEAMLDPAVAAIMPRLVDNEVHLALAKTVYGAFTDMSYALGPALGAVSYGSLGLAGVLAVDAATYGVAVLGEAAIRLTDVWPATFHPHVFKSYVRGFRMVWTSGPIKYLVINDTLNHLFPFLSVVLPYLIIGLWHGPNWAYGLMGFIATGRIDCRGLLECTLGQ